MLVNEFLEDSADAFPNKTALVCSGKKLSFLEIEHLANRLSNALIDLGVIKQDRIVILLEASVETVVSIFGILKTGGIFLVINPQVKANKIKYILNDCQAKALITDANHFKDLSAVTSECPTLETAIIVGYDQTEEKMHKMEMPIIHSYSEILDKYSIDRPQKRCIDIDLACLIYTSGSSGIPKGVMCTHQNVVSAASSIIEYLENTPEDIILDVLPLSFDYGLYQVLMSFKFGGTVVLEKSFLYPYTIIDLLIKEKVTGFPIVPTIVAILLSLKDLERFDFSSLRYITNTAQALPPGYITKLQQIFPGAKVYSMYGLTECKRATYLPPEELDKRPTSVGKAMPNTEVYLIDKNGKEITKAGEVGELLVRGANVMKGYWNLPEETERAYKPGPIPGEKVLYTGDLFKMDEEGFLYFISRMDDMIKTGGEKVSPKEIENVLYQIDDVNEAAVIGVNDDILGQAVKAFVVLKKKSELTQEDIIKYSSRHLENYMVPRYIEIRDKLPKSSHGKIAKKELK